MGRLEEILKEVLKIDEVREDMGPNNVKTWDSWNALMLVSKIEEAYKVSFSMEEVKRVKNVADIRIALQTRGAEFGDGYA